MSVIIEKVPAMIVCCVGGGAQNVSVMIVCCVGGGAQNSQS